MREPAVSRFHWREGAPIHRHELNAIEFKGSFACSIATDLWELCFETKKTAPRVCCTIKPWIKIHGGDPDLSGWMIN